MTVFTPWKHSSSSFRTSHVMEGLHNCNVARSSLHRITCDDVSCFMEDTPQKKNGSSWSPVFVSFDWIFVCGHVLSWCMCICMCTHEGQSYFLYLGWKRFTTLSFWREEKIWILRVGKIITIFSFMRMRRRNFYSFFIRISVVVSINVLFLFFKHVRITSCGVHPGSPCCPLRVLVHLHFLLISKAKVGSTLTKTVSLRVTLNIDGTPIRVTQCMWDV